MLIRICCFVSTITAKAALYLWPKCKYIFRCVSWNCMTEHLGKFCVLHQRVHQQQFLLLSSFFFYICCPSVAAFILCLFIVYLCIFIYSLCNDTATSSAYVVWEVTVNMDSKHMLLWCQLTYNTSKCQGRQQHRRCIRLFLNWGPPEYKPEVLKHEMASSVFMLFTLFLLSSSSTNRPSLSHYAALPRFQS
jgi:hypothetical protein